VSRDRELERRLRETPVPGEAEAEERSWELVRRAYAERAPAPSPQRTRRALLALAVGAAALAFGLSPAGARVGELVGDVVGIGAEDAKPQLRSLPAAGELLVESEQGVWIVREDGSKRLLGDYDQASWSPRGLFVAATLDRELVALEPDGDVRWTIPAPGRVRDPRWGGNELDTRIAYRSDEDLRVVPGDGDQSEDRLIARDVAPQAPAWLPPSPDSKLDVEPEPHLLAYLDARGRARVVDADGGEQIPASAVDRSRLDELGRRGVVSPGGRVRARVERRGGRSTLSVTDEHDRAVLFASRGRLTDPTWSPDGRWLLLGVPAADQWLFIRADRPGRLVAFDRISEQFDPGGSGEGRFPRVADWILPER